MKQLYYKAYKKFGLAELFFLTIFYLGTTDLKAQADTQFWFAVPFVGNHGNGNAEVIINNTKLSPVTVTITNPANPALGIPAGGITRTLPPGGFERIDLNQYYRTQNQDNAADPIGTLQQNFQPNAVRNTGLLIRATDTITAYYEVGRGGGQNCDIFSLKGGNALGTDFMLPIQNHYYNWGDRESYTAADIVATEDGTDVTITPTTAAVGRPAGVPFTIRLNRGQTYCLRAAGRAPNQQMSGTRISSNKPIAVSIIVDSIATGDDTSWGAGNEGIDMAGDQIVPLNLIGKEYIVVRGNAGNNGDRNRIFILTTEPNTNVQISENQNIVSTTAFPNAATTINYLQPSNSPATFIKSDKPVYVFYISGNQSELGGALIPPIKCTGSSRVVISRSSTNPFYFVILAKNDVLSEFRVNGLQGIILESDFSEVVPDQGTEIGYSAAKISFANNATLGLSRTNFPVGDAITISNSVTNATFHVGIANGGPAGEGSTARFGYFSDFASINISYENKPICFGDSLILDAGSGRDSYKWYTKPAATTENVLSNEQKYKVRNPGRQKIYLNVTKKNCPLTDSVEVYVQPKVNLNVLRKRIECANQPISMDATPEVTNPPLVINKYRWLWKDSPLPNDTIGQTTSISPQLPVGNHEIIVFVTDNQGCQSSDTVKVKINPNPAINLNFLDASVCSGDSLQLGIISPSVKYIYQWNESGTTPNSQVPATGLSSNIISNPKASKLNTTDPPSSLIHNYFIKTTDTSTSCVTLDTIQLTVHPIPKPQIDLPKSKFCNTEQSITLAGSASGFTGGTSVFSIANTLVTSFEPQSVNLGDTRLTLAYTSSAGCKASVDSILTVFSVPSISMADKEYCSGESTTIGVEIPEQDYTYQWSTNPDFTNINSHTATISIKNATNTNITNTYTLTATNLSNPSCTASGSVDVTIKPKPVASFGTVKPNGYCAGESAVTFVGSPTGGEFTLNNQTFNGTFNPNSVGSKEVKYRVSVDGCEDDTIVDITVHPLPNPVISGVDKPEYCVGEPDITISGTPLGGTFTRGAAGVYPLTTQGTANFAYTYTDANGCIDSTKVSFTVNPLPVLTVENTSPICQGETAVLTASGGDSYEWSGLPSTNNVSRVKPIITSTYPVRAVSDKGCKSAEQLIEVVVNPTPIANFAQKNITHCFEEGLLTLYAGTATDILWNNGAISDTLLVDKGGMYKVILSEGDCTAQDSVMILAACPPRIFVPKVFSPNNDGYNDSLVVLGEHFKDFKLLIFNRWGEVIYESNDRKKMWDGLYNGQPMPTGVYPYTITYRSELAIDKNKIFNMNGSISLIY